MIIRFDSFSCDIVKFDSILYDETINLYSFLLNGNSFNDEVEEELMIFENKTSKNLDYINKKYNTNLEVNETNHDFNKDLLKKLEIILSKGIIYKPEFWTILSSGMKIRFNMLLDERRNILEIIQDR